MVKRINKPVPGQNGYKENHCMDMFSVVSNGYSFPQAHLAAALTLQAGSR